MNDENKFDLSLEGIIQAIANINLEEDIDFDIKKFLKDKDKLLEIIEQMQVQGGQCSFDELGRLFNREYKCLKK